MGNKRGTIVSMQICQGHRQPMQFKNALRALANLGLEGDNHAHPSSSRQVLFMDEETLTRLMVKPGMIRENITTRGIDLKALPPKTRVRIGEVEFEITKPCEPCGVMDEIRSGLRAELEGQRGMLARVINSGEIHVGDAIEVMREPVFAKR